MRRMAFKTSLGNAISVVEKEVSDVEALLANAKHPRDERTLDSIRAKLNAVLRDLAYCASTLKKITTASSNPLLRKVIELAKKGKTESEISKLLEHEDAEVIGDAIVEARKKGYLKQSRWARIIERIAFRLGTKFGIGGGLIRPNGIVVPVNYANHLVSSEKEIIERNLLRPGEEMPKTNDVFDFLMDRGYIIVHKANYSGWGIEYKKSAVDHSNLKELLDYFMINNEENFGVHTERGEEDIATVEELEKAFGV